MRFSLFILIFFCSLNIQSQNNNYDSAEQLLYDVQSRNYDKAIAFLTHFLDSIENTSYIEFPDTDYFGTISLLTDTYIHNNQIYEADTVLNHALRYINNNEIVSPLKYLLYYAYGAFLSHMNNHMGALVHIKEAAQLLSAQENEKENLAVVMSSLATCHMNVDSLDMAKIEIDSAMSIIENFQSRFSLLK